MDNDLLINFVYENRFLWDIKDKIITTDTSRQQWEYIAAELNTSTDIIRSNESHAV